MKRLLLLPALIATTGGALAHDQFRHDPQLRRAFSQCTNYAYWDLMEAGLDAVARRYLNDCMEMKGYVRED